jgi:heme exporter protein B
MREVMLPVLQFPVAVPIFIAGVEGSTGALKGDPLSEFSGWIKLAAGFSIIFIVLSYLLFEYVLEE